MTRDLSLAYNEEIKLKNELLSDGQTLPYLHRAVKRKKVRPLFTKKSALVKLDQNGRTALHLAAIEGHYRLEIKKFFNGL